MARSKRNQKTSAAVKESPTRPSTSDSLLVCNGVQCEMGMETFRRYWKTSDEGGEGCAIKSVMSKTEIITAEPVENFEEQPTLNDRTDGNDNGSGSELNFPSQPGIHVKAEPEDCNNMVDSSPTEITNKETAPVTNSVSATQVKIEQDVAVQACGSSSGIVLINEGDSTVTIPPALHWVIPKSLNTLAESADGKDVSDSGTIQAAIVVSGSEPTNTLTLGGKHDSIRIRLLRTVETVDGTEVSKIVLKAEQCSENAVAEDVDNIVKQELLTCGDCVDVFTDPSEYENHCASHNMGKPFKCLHCPERFNLRLEMSTHMNDHSKKVFLCEKCQESFQNHEDFVIHSRSHDQGSSLAATKETEVLKSVNPEHSFRCSQCNKSFRDADSRKHHEFTHSEGELYPCDECGRTFREEDHLLDHLKLHLKTQTCDLCNKVFTNIFDFNEHYITHEHDTKVYQCVACKIACNNILSLRKHAATHGLKVRWCGDCGGSGHIEFSDGDQDAENTTGTEDEFFIVDYFTGEVKNPEQGVPGCEDDPLRIDDDLHAEILRNDPEEVEVEMKVDDVLLQNEMLEECDSNKEEDVTMDPETDTKESMEEPVKNGRRKRSHKIKDELQDDESKEQTITPRKRTKQKPKSHVTSPVKRTQVAKTAKKKEDESKLEVRVELRNRSKRRKSSGRGQESVLLTT